MIKNAHKDYDGFESKLNSLSKTELVQIIMDYAKKEEKLSVSFLWQRLRLGLAGGFFTIFSGLTLGTAYAVFLACILLANESKIKKMATVTGTPAKFSACGGSLINKVIYLISTSNASELIEVRDSLANTLFSKRQSALSGSISLELSRQLKSFLLPSRSNPSATFADDNSIKSFLYLR